LARLREAVTLMRRLWAEDRVTYKDMYYKTYNATIYDKPPGAIPAAHRRRRTADGQVCRARGRRHDRHEWQGRGVVPRSTPPGVRRGASESGRDPSKLDKLIEVKVSFDTDRQRALEDTRNWGALALSAQEKVHVEDPIEMERLADALPTERTATRWIVSTDPEEHVQRIRFYTDVGFNHLVFHAPGTDRHRFLDLYDGQARNRSGVGR
jgi:coenzyme F420-dependent glucose-6-phosphate dehydrogenase